MVAGGHARDESTFILPASLIDFKFGCVEVEKKGRRDVPRVGSSICQEIACFGWGFLRPTEDQQKISSVGSECCRRGEDVVVSWVKELTPSWPNGARLDTAFALPTIKTGSLPMNTSRASLLCRIPTGLRLWILETGKHAADTKSLSHVARGLPHLNCSAHPGVTRFY